MGGMETSQTQSLLWEMTLTGVEERMNRNICAGGHKRRKQLITTHETGVGWGGGHAMELG